MKAFGRIVSYINLGSSSRKNTDDVTAVDGPVLSYIAEASDDTTGEIWSKLTESGLVEPHVGAEYVFVDCQKLRLADAVLFESGRGTWATDWLLDKTGGMQNLVVPYVKPGNYLIRSEIMLAPLLPS